MASPTSSPSSSPIQPRRDESQAAAAPAKKGSMEGGRAVSPQKSKGDDKLATTSSLIKNLAPELTPEKKAAAKEAAARRKERMAAARQEIPKMASSPTPSSLTNPNEADPRSVRNRVSEVAVNQPTAAAAAAPKARPAGRVGARTTLAEAKAEQAAAREQARNIRNNPTALAGIAKGGDEEEDEYNAEQAAKEAAAKAKNFTPTKLDPNAIKRGEEDEE